MSKRLPYFQFEPAEYLAGDIMFCSYGAQGMFNNICALYWQKDCELKYSQTVKRFGNEDLIKELISECIIKVEKDKIIVNFLDEQYSKATIKSVVNSDNGKKGAETKWGKTDNTNMQKRSERLKEARIKGTHSKEEWEYLKLFFSECVNCGEKENLVKDHIVPIYQGGSDSITNLQPLCKSCNSSKGAKSEDLRISFCKNKGIKMPSEFIKMPSEMPSESLALREDKIKEEEIRKENNNDRFYSELIISESWIESTAMHSRQKLIPIEVKRFLKQYNEMINLQFEIKINKTEYCTHFINWLNKQEKKIGIKKPSLL